MQQTEKKEGLKETDKVEEKLSCKFRCHVFVERCSTLDDRRQRFWRSPVCPRCLPRRAGGRLSRARNNNHMDLAVRVSTSHGSVQLSRDYRMAAARFTYGPLTIRASPMRTTSGPAPSDENAVIRVVRDLKQTGMLGYMCR